MITFPIVKHGSEWVQVTLMRIEIPGAFVSSKAARDQNAFDIAMRVEPYV